jgi:choline dehydrogenase-like flavoprotein
LGSHFGVAGLPGTYDYVILGGGTAGITLAHRLASDGRYTVALVNAGDFAEFANGNYSQVPALASFFGGSNPFLKNPVLDFDQYTAKQPVSIRAFLAMLLRRSRKYSGLFGSFDNSNWTTEPYTTPFPRCWEAEALVITCGSLG